MYSSSITRRGGKTDDPDYVYYNATIVNNATGSTVNGQAYIDPQIVFNETRDKAIIENASDYYVSLLRFTMEGATKNLPLFIPTILEGTGQTNVNLTAYSMAVSYQQTVQVNVANVLSYYTVVGIPPPRFIQWAPQIVNSVLAPTPKSMASPSFLGQYSSSATYNVGQIVANAPASLITQSYTDPTTTFSQVINAPSWSSGTSYVANSSSIVSYTNQNYTCIANNSNTPPPTSASWNFLNAWVSTGTFTSTPGQVSNGVVSYIANGLPYIPLSQSPPPVGTLPTNTGYYAPLSFNYANGDGSVTWSSVTAYTVGQQVVYGSVKWTCIIANTNSAPVPLNINWFGQAPATWSSSITYKIGSIVYLSSIAYTCIATTLNNTPASSPSYWTASSSYCMNPYSLSVTYSPGNVVYNGAYGNLSFVATQTTTNNTPPTNNVSNAYWAAVSNLWLNNTGAAQYTVLATNTIAASTGMYFALLASTVALLPTAQSSPFTWAQILGTPGPIYISPSAWNSTIAYNPGAAVTYLTGAYVNITAVAATTILTSTIPPPLDPTHWSLGFANQATTISSLWSSISSSFGISQDISTKYYFGSSYGYMAELWNTTMVNPFALGDTIANLVSGAIVSSCAYEDTYLAFYNQWILTPGCTVSSFPFTTFGAFFGGALGGVIAPQMSFDSSSSKFTVYGDTNGFGQRINLFTPVNPSLVMFATPTVPWVSGTYALGAVVTYTGTGTGLYNFINKTVGNTSAPTADGVNGWILMNYLSYYTQSSSGTTGFNYLYQGYVVPLGFLIGYSFSAYICTTSYTVANGATTGAPPSANWTLAGQIPSAYVSTTSYTPGQIVSYLGTSYVALVGTTGSTPANGATWNSGIGNPTTIGITGATLPTPVTGRPTPPITRMFFNENMYGLFSNFDSKYFNDPTSSATGLISPFPQPVSVQIPYFLPFTPATPPSSTTLAPYYATTVVPDGYVYEILFPPNFYETITNYINYATPTPAIGVPVYQQKLYWQTQQEMMSVDSIWSPISSLVFQTTLLPVRPEATGAPVSLGQGNTGFSSATVPSAFQPLITDVPIDQSHAGGSANYRQFILYEPLAEFRLSDMGHSKTDIRAIDISVFWRHRLTNALYPITMFNLSSVSVKLMFKHKNAPKSNEIPWH